MSSPLPPRAGTRPAGRSHGSLANDGSSSKVAHTLTACCRCRNRKSRCDATLPKCLPCEKAGAYCEYFDSAKGKNMPRAYVVRLQDTVQELEAELAALELDSEPIEPDPEKLVRDAANVKFTETDEEKYLGPASGTNIARLVMELAKQVTHSKSISSIISEERAKQAKDVITQEEDKPTSKVYPLVSSCANHELPPEHLATMLLNLFNTQVQTMYPVFHEPDLTENLRQVYGGSKDPYQNFVVFMVIAIGLQRMSTQFAGLGDSFYLAALSYFEEAIRPMNLQTLQCFFLIGEYSLLTPTRTAVFYVIGLAVRLLQDLGLDREETLIKGTHNELQRDMRRRVFWAIVTMDYGLAHALGRPSMMSTAKDAIDVKFFMNIDDSSFTAEGGVSPNAPPSTRKWVAIHFYQMRMLQLEIRRKLYLKKRPSPVDDQDPWFLQMQRKLEEWRDASPDDPGSSGFNNVWFKGRYHTMVVFLWRPSPQIPRPSAKAATMCYDACQWNVYMHSQQVKSHSVETTWAFTQSIFMAVNTILWSLAYEEVRRAHPKEEVEGHLKVAFEAMQMASERWPGVAPARELYEALSSAILRVYDKDGDFPLSATSPYSEPLSPPSNSDPLPRSMNTTPSQSVSPSQPPLPHHQYLTPHEPSLFRHTSPPLINSRGVSNEPPESIHLRHSIDSNPWSTGTWSVPSDVAFDPESQFNQLPENFPEVTSWSMPSQWANAPIPTVESFPMMNPLMQDAGSLLIPQASTDQFADLRYSPYFPSEMNQNHGLNAAEQVELMQDLERYGPTSISDLIEKHHAMMFPQATG